MSSKKQKLKRRIDQMDEKKAERLENDKSRFKKWAKSVLSTTWDVIKSAIGGAIAALFA